MKKKFLSLFVLLAITIFNFEPTMVSATTTMRQGYKIVNTTSSETLTFKDKEHNSTIYAGEIKKDGVTVLNYLYSDDVTRSSVLFDNVRKALSNPYSDMVPSIVGKQNTVGLHEISTQTLNGVDLTTITSGWTNASSIATQIYNGTNTDIVNSNMYDVDDEFKAEVDRNDTERAVMDNPVATNKRIISHLGTQTTDAVGFKVIEGDLYEIHNVDLIYLSEATTVIYTSVNVIEDSTPIPTKINEVSAIITAPEVGTKIVDENTKPNITLDSNANYTVSWTMYVNNYPSVDSFYDSGAIFGTTVEDDEYYYLEVFLTPKEGYEFDSSNNVRLNVNGATEYELGYCSDNQFSFFTKVKATAKEEASTYEYIAGAEQTYTIGTDETVSFRINADYNLFENGGKVYVDGNLVDLSNYTSKSGSTIITFTKTYISSLSVGNHTIKVEFNNGGTAETTFIVASANTILEDTTSNPQTGDNIETQLMLLGISLVGLIGAGIYLKRNKLLKNN